ncbi:hypothetical protein LOM8899_02657 [Flavimaricola marinus]|uniref:Uncharacterized protein n=1 Tax=Flavimaricola marinus TaxID=1819565 RepID=A0A238LGF8_9RHOB|nr:hypothetical protein LOM8899_02657 [Flavimaricola marinus]
MEVQCQLCFERPNSVRSVAYFGDLKLFACDVCTTSSLGPSISTIHEEPFQNHCVANKVSLPALNRDGLYGLPKAEFVIAVPDWAGLKR